MADLVERACPFCASSGNARWVRPDGLHVRECSRCESLFASPAPSGRQLSEFYAHYDENHRRYAEAEVPELRAAYLSNDPAADLRIRELRSLVRVEGLRVLDVGFGRGEFLFQLQRLGAIAHGLELDDRAIIIARTLGLDNVRRGTLEDVPHGEVYDLVVLNDVIEHTLDPRRMLELARSVLRPGGLILVWTPNGGLARGERHPVALRVDLEHMQYLAPATCLYVATQLELRLQHLETCGVPHLDGIDRAPGRTLTLKDVTKNLVRRIPGFSAANTLRRVFVRNDERSGAYHLFCVFQKR